MAPCFGEVWLAGPFFGLRFSCSASSRASLILALSSAWSLSVPLCLGNSAHIFLRAARRSSAVWARLYSASASRYCGVRLAGMVLLLCGRSTGGGRLLPPL